MPNKTPPKKPSAKQQRIKLIITLSLIILFYILIFVILRIKMPDIAQLLVSVEQIYGAYGYLLIFLGAMIEATFIIGFYIPGSFIFLLGVSLARLGITSFPIVIFYGTLGYCFGYSLNYCLGRYGWFKIIDTFGIEKQLSEAKKHLIEHYNKTLFWGYMISSTGSMVSTASGIMKIPFKIFIYKTTLIQIFWSLLLGGLAYLFGMTFINIFVIYFGTIAFFSFMLYFIRNTYKRKNKKNNAIHNFDIK